MIVIRNTFQLKFGKAKEAVALMKEGLAIQKKLGFTQTGESRVHCLARKQEVRHIDTQLTRANWACRVRTGCRRTIRRSRRSSSPASATSTR